MGNTILRASLTGDLSEIGRSVHDNPSCLTERTRCGKTALHLAGLNGHLEVVEFILNFDPTLVDQEDKEGNNVLHWACFKGNLKVVIFLVNHDPYLMLQKNNYDETPIDVAKHWEKQLVVDFLENCPQPELMSSMSSSNSGGASAGVVGIGSIFQCSTNILVAARTGNLLLVKRLIKADKTCLLEKTRCGQTPLHVASQKGHLLMVKFIARIEPSLVGFKDKQGWTALHWACWNGRFNVVEYMARYENPKLLLEKDEKGDTPLHLACRNRQMDIAKFLVQQNPELMGIANNKGVKPYGRIKSGQRLHTPSTYTPLATPTTSSISSFKTPGSKMVHHRSASTNSTSPPRNMGGLSPSTGTVALQATMMAA